jgi:hypothetical protein
MLSSNMLLLNLIPLIDVTFSTPTPVCINYDELSRMKLLSRLFPRKPVPKTEEEIAALIEGFANGTGGRWDWDYFISTDFVSFPALSVYAPRKALRQSP